MRRHSWERISYQFKVLSRIMKVLCHIEIGERPRWDQWFGQNSLGKNSWRQLSLIGDETIINLQRTSVYVFSDSVLSLGRILQHPDCNEAWKNRIAGVMSEKNYRDYDGINGEPTEFEWNIFAGFDALQLCDKVKDLLSRLGEKPEYFTGRILFMSMFNDISCGKKTMKKNVWQMPESSKYLQRSLVLDSGHLLVQVPKRSGILWKRTAHKEFGIYRGRNAVGIRRKCRESYSIQQNSGHLIFRATTPLSRGKLKRKGHGKLSIHFTADYSTIETIFRIIVSANQLCLYGAVAKMCEEFESHPDRSGDLKN